MSISGLKRINSKERGRLRQSPKTEEISGQIGLTTIDLGEILLGTLVQLLLRRLTLHFESLYTRSRKKLRMSHTLNGRTRWGEGGTPRSTIKAFTTSTTISEDMPLRIVGLCGIIWNSWLRWES